MLLPDSQVRRAFNQRPFIEREIAQSIPSDLLRPLVVVAMIYSSVIALPRHCGPHYPSGLLANDSQMGSANCYVVSV